jgi:hypothetical protein
MTFFLENSHIMVSMGLSFNSFHPALGKKIGREGANEKVPKKTVELV